MTEDKIILLAEQVLETCRIAGLRVATAESCTGGLIGGALTELAGSSDVVECGWVTYSNRSKSDLIGVPPDLIARVGAVSAEVAACMAEGALIRSSADLAVSATGIAGPGGGGPDKPVGLVFLAAAARGKQTRTARNRFAGDRAAVRRQSVEAALKMLLAATGRA